MSLGLIVVVFAVVLVIGTPMGVALSGIAALPSLLKHTFPYGPENIVRTMATSLDSFLLLAIPLFMFSGVIMAKGGISEKLFNIFAYFCGTITAGFPAAVIFTCLFYGAISGSGPATAAAVGTMTIPYMVERGYDRVFAAALVAVAGGLGVIIPPSIPMIVYSTISGASVGQMFIAGILPGLLIAGCLIAYSWFYCKFRGEDKENLRQHSQRLRAGGFLPLLKDGIWALLAPIIILGSIYGGVATPTEAASISVYYALFVSLFIYKSIKIKDLIPILQDSVRTYAPILFVIACAMALSRVVTLLQVAKIVEQAVLSTISTKFGVLILINIILLVAGMVIDTVPAIMLFSPILLPLANTFHIDQIHLGMLMIVNLAIGFITPPVGVNLFVTSNMTGIPILTLAKSAAPFIIAFLVALALVTFVPAITLALL